MEDNELLAYRAAVEDYARKRVDYLFHNKGDEHALIILSTLFKNAKSHIRIAANKLCNDSVVNTKEYIESMRSFLDRNDTHLSILITYEPSIEEINSCERDNCFYWMLFNHPAFKGGRVEIKQGNGKSFKDGEGTKINFCTGDDEMFRLENNVEERTAIANFNNQAFTARLIDAFDAVFREQLNVELSRYFCNAPMA